MTVIDDNTRRTARDLLSTLPLFGNLKDGKATERLANLLHYEAFTPGERILRQGALSNGLYILLAGEAVVSVDGRSIALLHAGQTFGEMGLVGDYARSADVIARIPCLCCYLIADDFRQAMAEMPRIALNLMRALSLRIRSLNEILISARITLGSSGSEKAYPGPLALLQAVPLFAGLADERFLLKVASIMKEEHFPQGFRIFDRGDAGHLLYVIARGSVGVHLDELELMKLGSGQYFGEMSLLDQDVRSMSVTTREPTCVFTLSRGQFYAALMQSPETLSNILELLSSRIRHMNRAIVMSHSADHIAVPALQIFPETANADLWIRDPETGKWSLPLRSAHADVFAEFAEDVDRVPVSGFENSIQLDTAALDAALRKRHRESRCGRDGDAEVFGNLCVSLSPLLRSPLFPKRSHDKMADLLLAATEVRPLRIKAVLASPTAQSEIGDFLRVVRFFQEQGIATDPQFLLVRWENFNDVQERSEADRRQDYETVRRSITKRVQLSGFGAPQVVTFDLVIGPTLKATQIPTSFASTFEAVSNALSDPNCPDPALRQNLLWIQGFYARQQSLRRLGDDQAVIDLAVRQSIGTWINGSVVDDGSCIILTSELNARFLRCYGADQIIVNINLTKP